MEICSSYSVPVYLANIIFKKLKVEQQALITVCCEEMSYYEMIDSEIVIFCCQSHILVLVITFCFIRNDVNTGK